MNLFIVKENSHSISYLGSYLVSRFGDNFEIYIFFDFKCAMRMVDKQTKILIFDFDPIQVIDSGIFEEIKKKNQNINIIFNSTPEKAATVINGLLKSWKRNKGFQGFLKKILNLIQEPLKFLAREIPFNKYFLCIIFINLFYSLHV